MLSVSIVLIAIVGTINIANYISTNQALDAIFPVSTYSTVPSGAIVTVKYRVSNGLSCEIPCFCRSFIAGG